MFATSSRSRRHMQPAERGNMTVEPPPPGSDSCFGVRSLNGSVEWSSEGLETGQAEMEITDDLPEGEHAGGEALAEREGGTEDELKVAAEDSILAPAPSLSEVADKHDKLPKPTVQPILVPSPTLFLPTLSTTSPPESGSTRQSELQDPDHPLSEYSTDDDGDAASSAPPSPTSLNSLPSYLASDISMPSSPGIGYSTGPGSAAGRSNSRSPLRTGSGGVGAALQALERERARSIGTIRRLSKYNHAQKGCEEEEEEAPDLVIPTLSLPSSSLHLSLRPFIGRVEGIKIALVGDAEETKAFLRLLEAQEELVEVNRAKGWIGVMRAGELAAVLITGLSVIQIKHRILRSYSALNDLLNPAATKGDQPRLRDIISRYADREDWVHACLYLDEHAPLPPDLAALVYALPLVIRSPPVAETPFFSTRLSTPSPPAARMDDPTPMACTEASSYFSQPLGTRRPASPIIEDPPDASPLIRVAVSALQELINDAQLRSASVDHFLSWRPAPATLESSHSSIDTTSAGTSGAGGLDREAPMPTVARAQGGGEWEAGLSRRMAKRRDTLTGRRAAAESSGKRRRSKGTASRPVTDDLPLFPTSKRSSSRNSESRPAGLGVKDLLERTFAPMKKGLKGWRGVVLVAAVVGVVGLGWWFGRKN